MKRKYKMELQVKEVKISTTLYSINHCQKWKYFQNSNNFFGNVSALHCYVQLFIAGTWLLLVPVKTAVGLQLL